MRPMHDAATLPSVFVPRNVALPTGAARGLVSLAARRFASLGVALAVVRFER